MENDKIPSCAIVPKVDCAKYWHIRGLECAIVPCVGVYIHTPTHGHMVWHIHPTPFLPPFGTFGTFHFGTSFLTAALIVAESVSAGARLTAPNYETTTFPTWEASVHRTRVSPLPVSGFSLETTKKNERTETAETTSPRPWQIIRRETKATKTCHHKSHTYALVDANGRDVWHTLANMRLICAAVNGNRH